MKDTNDVIRAALCGAVLTGLAACAAESADGNAPEEGGEQEVT